MFYVGLDDTDIVGSRGTNKLALQIVEELKDDWLCHQILRHQLLEDERVPFTSKNGSASLIFSPLKNQSQEDLYEEIRRRILREFIDGSDPGLVVTSDVPESLVQFGHDCQSRLMTQDEAYELADIYNIRMEGLGGTNDGIIGALAAIGLAATENDGRIIYLDGWSTQLEGQQSVEMIRQYDVTVMHADRELSSGIVTLPKKLRPNKRNGRNVLFVEQTTDGYQALKLP